MSNVIQFLESMGGNALMSRMTAAHYEAEVAMLDADDEAREALVLRDHSRLNGLLEGRAIMMCVIAAPEDKPAEQDSPSEGEGQDGDEKSPAE